MARTTKEATRRHRSAAAKEMTVPAIQISQGRGKKVFAFPIDGKALSSFATVTRIARDSRKRITGYQRPEVLSHVTQIKKYLESEDPMLPNAIVIAFDRTVRFAVAKGWDASDAKMGSLIIPLPQNEEDKPGLIVDGQQRSAALREAQVKRFPVFVIGFIAEDPKEQREQFLLVNSTKPLPKGLLYELLPSIDSPLPEALARRKFPAALLERLNHDQDSPFRGLISTPTAPGGVVKDNSVLRMLENSLTDGALFRFRKSDAEGGDMDDMLRVVKHFWLAASNVFPDAWGKPPKRSRLMHGAGIVSLGFLMDAIADRHRKSRVPSVSQFTTGLTAIASDCRWTDGYWKFSAHHDVKWCDLQNTAAHIQILTDYLLARYRAASLRQ